MAETILEGRVEEGAALDAFKEMQRARVAEEVGEEAMHAVFPHYFEDVLEPFALSD